MRAIWSDAPPAPAATTISTGLVGCQSAACTGVATVPANIAASDVSSVVVVSSFPIGRSMISSSSRYIPTSIDVHAGGLHHPGVARDVGAHDRGEFLRRTGDGVVDADGCQPPADIPCLPDSGELVVPLADELRRPA